MPDSMGFTPGLVPGGNPSGGSTAVPAPGSTGVPAIGGGSNPFLPSFPAGQSVPPPTSPINTAVPGGPGGTPGTPGLQGLNVGSALGLHGTPGGWAGNQQDFIKAMHKAGFSAGDAALLYNFINSGAGFNQDAINALFASMQPQIQRGEADILEQLGAMGNRQGSAAATGLGDYLAQVNLNQGQIEAGMYEQAVQNYLTVLMAGKGPAPQNAFQNIMQFMQQMASNAGAAATLAKTG